MKRTWSKRLFIWVALFTAIETLHLVFTPWSVGNAWIAGFVAVVLLAYCGIVAHDHHQSERIRTCNKSGFTLVELLIVLAIIGLLAGMGITAMHKIGASQRLASATRQFANDINMARNYAIVNSTYLYLVVGTETATNSIDLPFGSYGFCVPSQGSVTNAANDMTKVKYIDDIRYLPQGVVFGSETTTFADGLPGFEFVALSSIAYPDDTSAPKMQRVVTFTPNGQILPMARRPSFVLYEGIYDATTATTKRIAVSNRTYRVSINPLIGKPRTTSL